jgi:chromosome segregation ATPase
MTLTTIGYALIKTANFTYDRLYQNLQEAGKRSNGVQQPLEDDSFEKIYSESQVDGVLEQLEYNHFLLSQEMTTKRIEWRRNFQEVLAKTDEIKSYEKEIDELYKKAKEKMENTQKDVEVKGSNVSPLILKGLELEINSYTTSIKKIKDQLSAAEQQLSLLKQTESNAKKNYERALESVNSHLAKRKAVMDYLQVKYQEGTKEYEDAKRELKEA